jgi:hypothetical protein
MEISMNTETYDYIYSKGKIVTLDLIVSSGCCGGTTEANVSLKAPKDPSSYKSFSYNDIQIYIRPIMNFKDNIVEIKLRRSLMIKELSLPTLQLKL